MCSSDLRKKSMILFDLIELVGELISFLVEVVVSIFDAIGNRHEK